MTETIARNVLLVLIVVVVLVSVYVGNRIARKKESGIDPMGDFVIKETKATLISAVGCIVMGCFLLAVALLVFASDPKLVSFAPIFYAFSGFMFVLGVYYIAKYLVWEIRIENDAITYRRLFKGTTVIPLSSIVRISVGEGSVQGTKTGMKVMHLFDIFDNRLLSVRSTLKGYEPLYQRLQAHIAQSGIPGNIIYPPPSVY